MSRIRRERCAILLCGTAILFQCALSLASGPPELDLPMVPPPRPGSTPAPPAPPPEPEELPEPEEDPRDATPAPTFYGVDLEAARDSLVYVLDASGSMQSWATATDYVGLDGRVQKGHRWDRAKAECVRSIRGLSPNVRFGVVVYNCGQRLWRSELAEASPRNKASAELWLRGIFYADGMTGTGPACAVGFSLGSDALVLLTDGEPNCGANGLAGHRSMIARTNARAARVDVFGVGASGTWRAWCQRVAADHGGRYVDVP